MTRSIPMLISVYIYDDEASLKTGRDSLSLSPLTVRSMSRGSFGDIGRVAGGGCS